VSITFQYLLLFNRFNHSQLCLNASIYTQAIGTWKNKKTGLSPDLIFQKDISR